MLKNKRILLTILVVILLLLVPSIVNAADGEANITSLEVTAPQSGVYAAGQQITIRMNFDKAIKGTMPNLEIYFGTAEKKEVTAPSVTTAVNYVDYTYTIRAEDNGKLRLFGIGTATELKDENDNSIYLNRTYDLTGNAIYAENSITRADLSNAEFKWVQVYEYDNKYLNLEMKNATTIKENNYYVHLSHNKDEQVNVLDYDNKNIWEKNLVTDKNLIYGVEELAAENGDLYIWVCEVDKTSKVPKMLVSAKKIERLKQLPLGCRIKSYFFNEYTSTNIYEPLGDETRKINVKIGNISDISILRAIKNGETDCMQKLLNYAKSNEGFHNVQISVGNYDSIVSNLNLVNKEYYFVYMSVEDKDGKYYPIEDVSLYQALVSDSVGVNLFDYLDDKFTWNLDEGQANNPTSQPEQEKEPVSNTGDKTTAPGKIPYTGKTTAIILFILAVIVLGVYAYKRNNDLKGI